MTKMMTDEEWNKITARLKEYGNKYRESYTGIKSDAWYMEGEGEFTLNLEDFPGWTFTQEGKVLSWDEGLLNVFPLRYKAMNTLITIMFDPEKI